LLAGGHRHIGGAEVDPAGADRTRDKRGVWAYYGLVPEALNALSAVLRTS
jgi:hypothetical protein